jgi:hypothetical protein
MRTGQDIRMKCSLMVNWRPEDIKREKREEEEKE